MRAQGRRVGKLQAAFADWLAELRGLPIGRDTGRFSRGGGFVHAKDKSPSKAGGKAQVSIQKLLFHPVTCRTRREIILLVLCEP